ncbi:MAG: hypothetical protein IJH12_10500 [Clostridia bacterium]|nr:hypothetical protein [Clostridia bacterium]
MKENKYVKLKEKQQEEINEFPIKYAFGDKQFENAMRELGLTVNDIDKVIGVGYGGGFMLKEDYPKYKEMLSRQYEEIQYEILNDREGTGFIKDMFSYELANHEYGYTRELDETLIALGITYNDIEENENLQKGLNLAIKDYDRAEEEEL